MAVYGCWCGNDFKRSDHDIVKVVDQIGRKWKKSQWCAWWEFGALGNKLCGCWEGRRWVSIVLSIEPLPYRDFSFQQFMCLLLVIYTSRELRASLSNFQELTQRVLYSDSHVQKFKTDLSESGVSLILCYGWTSLFLALCVQASTMTNDQICSYSE